MDGFLEDVGSFGRILRMIDVIVVTMAREEGSKKVCLAKRTQTFFARFSAPTT